jgi:hypothetical protein
LECKICEGQIKPTCFYSEEKTREGGQGGRTTPVIIPPPCAKPVEESDIQLLVRAETWAKYERFKFQRKHKNARVCPWCETPELGDPGQPEMECGNEKCGKQFCYFHSNAHVGKTCTEYEQRMHEENLKNQAMISSIAKVGREGGREGGRGGRESKHITPFSLILPPSLPPALPRLW